MNRLDKINQEKEKALNGRKNTGNDSALPTFSTKGRVIRPEHGRRLKYAVIICAVIAFLTGFIYLPQLFIKDTVSSGTGSIPADTSVKSLIKEVTRSNWTSDFDGDGLDNQSEDTQGTDPYDIDTDGDGICDYAEIHITKTSPVTWNNTLLERQKLSDQENGSSVNSPYKIGNVVLWAEDYESKAYGSVVETDTGYRFCGFTGYAQFSLYKGWYAYKVENGVHTLLPYREEENVWQVSAGDTVELYEDRLADIVMLTVFGNPVYVDCNIITGLLADLLPEKGFICACRITSADVVTGSGNMKLADIAIPSYDETSGTRFTKNTVQLSDLMYVRDCIDRNECVAFTIYHEDVGEKRGIIFGYTEDNTLLCADCDTLEYAGILQLTEQAEMMMDVTGNVVSYEYFTFDGFGASSDAGFRINFFASTSGQRDTSLQTG